MLTQTWQGTISVIPKSFTDNVTAGRHCLMLYTNNLTPDPNTTAVVGHRSLRPLRHLLFLLNLNKAPDLGIYGLILTRDKM